MRLTLTAFGLKLDVRFGVDDDSDDDGPGDHTSQPVGFTAQHGDQRYQPGPDLG